MLETYVTASFGIILIVMGAYVMIALGPDREKIIFGLVFIMVGCMSFWAAYLFYKKQYNYGMSVANISIAVVWAYLGIDRLLSATSKSK